MLYVMYVHFPQFQLKVHFYVNCLIKVLSVPVATIGNMGASSVARGYSAADTFSDDRVDAVRQRTCQRCAFAGDRYSASYRFQIIDHKISPKLPKGTQKCDFFLEKLPFNGKISKFRCKRIHANTDSRIPAKFRGNR